MENEFPISIDLDDLSVMLRLVLDHIKNQQGNEVQISEDYYWEISDVELYDPTKDPTDFTLGQLTHDWERLNQIQNGDEPPIGYSLVWLSAVLRAVGHKYVP
jgi:hypothetical protein